MVFVTRVLYGIPHRSRKGFIDSLRIYVRGGTGGNGTPKFGGIGGKGGDVYVEASENSSLKQIAHTNPSKRFSAKLGENSRTYQIVGNPGADLIIPVPLGVTIVDDSGRTLADLNHAGERVLIARGGSGGCPQNQFAGQKGQTQMVTLDLKLIADVGFVGFPNAGKSTLLKALSRATPKIAAYPFTTLKPEIGVMRFQDDRQISLADLPGLIEGAHRNFGLGHSFLKHVIRTKMLLFVVDVDGFQLSPDYPRRDAFETVMLLNKELELYKDDLIDKPAILAVNKMDVNDAEEKFQKVNYKLREAIESDGRSLPDALRPEELIEFDAILPISAKKAFNIKEIKEKIRSVIDYHAEKQRGAPLSAREIIRREESQKTHQPLLL